MKTDITKVFSGPTPPGFDIDAAIDLARQKSIELNPADMIVWFNNMFRNNKKLHLPIDISWDVKQIDSKYQDFGNFLFGYLGSVAGITPLTLQVSGGFAQGRTDKLPDINTIARIILNWGGTYGDRPEDTVEILKGIAAATFHKINGAQKADLFFVTSLRWSGKIIELDGEAAILNSGIVTIKVAGAVNTIIVDDKNGAVNNYQITVNKVIGGALSGSKIVNTLNSQTGENFYTLETSSGNSSNGNIATNGNISFLVNDQLFIVKNGALVAKINYETKSGILYLINGDILKYEAGQIRFNPTSGIFTSIAAFNAGGVKIDGLIITSTGNSGALMTATGCVPALGMNLPGLLDIEQYLAAAKIGGANATLIGMCTKSITDTLVNTNNFYTSIRYGSLDLSPIGAFYESKSAGFDAATSIAHKTLRIMTGAGVALTTTQLSARDTNADGKVSGAELNGLFAWRDLNEDGVLTQTRAGNEMPWLDQALSTVGLTSIRASDYAFYTAGNAGFRSPEQSFAAVPSNSLVAPAAAVSNFATLRSSDNRFFIGTYQWIDWSAKQVKISSNQLNIVGTEGNDAFDLTSYAAYDGVYFNLKLVQNFYGGGGNDYVGGSQRNDNIWGGTGNDALLGYAGDDKLYGEEGNDELQGGLGNDLLDGGVGDDRLFGQVGNDTLIGGDGGDIMMGFTSVNDAKQTLAAGEADDDTMFGGNGADQMFGGLGNDYLDAGADNDLAMGGDGNDTVYGAAGDDELNGGTGNDILDGGIGADKMFGGVGNDQLWGGDGNDIMLGFNPVNDAKQTLAPGETDNDLMYGGAGDDLMLGGLGDDQLWGGVGNDELQGDSGNDALYGEDGADKLFGGVGNDVLYGGAGDDVIVGFMPTNDAKQTLAAGETDDDFLYGGAGNDILLGGLGNDYLDGGAGADSMEGGQGNDIYVVNSVNDVILEQQDQGYDTVVSSSNYILNANIEELRLVEGATINGTGNRLNNRIIGNSQDNILDGVTGADAMIGGLGNDTYYVDNGGDQVIELLGEGTDTVNSSISQTLGANLENLELLDFSKAEKGIADGINILVYGFPKAFELDYMQGNAVAGYAGTCALTAIANLGTQAKQSLSEAQVVQTAIDNKWCVTDAAKTDYQRGGSNYIGQQALLNNYGIRNGIVMGYNEQAIANLIKGGRGVIIGLNADKLWGTTNSENGGVNHVVTVTGVACDAATGALNGFYIADSGRGKVSDMTRYVSIADFRANANVANAYAIYTVEPIKLWEENINATGNELDNRISGNRGNNVLSGGKGNDTVSGGAGNDTYRFARGDGQDTLIDSDATLGNIDVLQLSNANQTNLWFKHIGNNLQINLMGSTDQITLKDWYVGGTTGTDNQIEQIKTADGLTMFNSDVERFVQAMAGFAPPSAAQTSWTHGQVSNGQVLLAVSH